MKKKGPTLAYYLSQTIREKQWNRYPRIHAAECNAKGMMWGRASSTKQIVAWILHHVECTRTTETEKVHVCVCVDACANTAWRINFRDIGRWRSRTRMLRVIYEWNKMKYKRKLYLSKNWERGRGKNGRRHTRTFVRTICFIVRFISNDLCTCRSSSLVVKVEKATHFKNSFQLREATNHRVIC